MKVTLNMRVDSETAKKLIRYAELLERVQMRKYPDAQRIDDEITEMLDKEDRRTARELFLERSKSYTIHNCGVHESVAGEEGCKNQDSKRCYDCDCWEPIRS
jgi:hypothetical protein